MAKVANYEFDVLVNFYTHTSDTFFEIFGLDRKQTPVFTPDLFWSLVHPDDVEKVKFNLHLPAPLDVTSLEYRIVRPSGQIVYIHRIQEIVRDKTGRHIKTIGTIQDITDRKITELALKQNEERFRSLVQNGSDLIGIINQQGTYLFVGENVIEHLGFTAEEMVGRNAFEFIHPDDIALVGTQLQKILDQPQITTAHFRFKNRKGSWQWLETTVTNHLDNPSIAGLVVNSKDVTEKLKKEEENQQYVEQLHKLSLIAKETTNLIILQDSEQRITWVNNAFVQLTGYTLEECIGKQISEICDGPETRPEVLHYVKEMMKNKEPFRIETMNYKKNKEIYWSDISSQPVFNNQGEIVQYFSIATNITERKRLENQLEREQKKQHTQIAAAILKAQEHERSIVSQELHDNVNQVLTTVKLYTEMCRDGIGNPKEIMDKSIHLLQDSIHEIRCLSKRLSAPSLGKIKLAESIKELVDAVVATNKFAVQLNTIRIEQLEVIQEVHLAVYRILQEHLTNVLKHSGASFVKISLDSVMGFIHLRVTDNGKGFDTSKKSNGIGITNMFTRAESLNGNLLMNSKPGEGCELHVSVPM